jgi:glycosyltransferase involved in cell wall biosynthesis
MFADADIIIPVTVPTPLLYTVASMCLRSARASSDANIIVVLNNSDWKLARMIRDECDLQNIRVIEMKGPFSISKALNLGAATGNGKYIAYAQCDILFFDGWLDRLVELWEENPEYFVLWPFTFSLMKYGQSYRRDFRLHRQLVNDGFPQGALSVVKRSDGYRWDEQFPFWEADADFSLHIERNKLKSALCLWSRVDHIPMTIGQNINHEKHFGVSDMGVCRSEASARLRAKWNLPMPKEP